jgi:hypothetical protein
MFAKLEIEIASFIKSAFESCCYNTERQNLLAMLLCIGRFRCLERSTHSKYKDRYNAATFDDEQRPCDVDTIGIKHDTNYYTAFYPDFL